MDFPTYIKHLRQSQFLSQASFAKELGLSFSTINRWETGKTKPNYRTLRLIDAFCKKNGISFVLCNDWVK